MAPKKRPHGKDVVSSSSTPPHYDKRRFWNEEAENIYNTLITKNMHRERGVDTSCVRVIEGTLFTGSPFLQRAVNRQWLKFVEQPGTAVVSLVREFYANLKVRHQDFKVRVRGKMVSFNKETINTVYSMPNYEADEYRELMAGTVNYFEIMQRICVPGASWKLNLNGDVVNFESKYLQRDAYDWFAFITSRIMPSNHTSQVTKERAALVYCIFNGDSVDVGQLVQSSILQAVRGTTTLSLPHTSLITELCRHAGVKWDDNEELLQPRSMIDVMDKKRNRRGVVEHAPEDDTAQHIPVPLQIQDADPPPQGPTMDARMSAMENTLTQHIQNFETHRRQVEEHMRYMHAYNVALSQRFPSSSDDYMPFPHPPTWPSQPRDDDDFDMGPGGGN